MPMRKEEIKDTTKTVLTVVEERLQLIKNEIIGVLILIEDNLHTSASKYGLEARGINLRLMEEKLIKLLYPDEEPDDKKEVIEEMYWEWVRKQESKLKKRVYHVSEENASYYRGYS